MKAHCVVMLRVTSRATKLRCLLSLGPSGWKPPNVNHNELTYNGLAAIEQRICV